MGFPRELFIDSVDEEFICSICLSVFDKPVQDCEQHVFCEKCINTWYEEQKTCPLTRHYIFLTQNKFQASRIVKNLLIKLKMRCSFAEDGCTEILNVENFSQHESICKYNREKVNFCTLGCNLPLIESETHNCLNELKKELKELKSKLATTNEQLLSKEQLVQKTKCDMNHKIREITVNMKKQTEQEVKKAKMEASKLRVELNRIKDNNSKSSTISSLNRASIGTKSKLVTNSTSGRPPFAL